MRQQYYDPTAAQASRPDMSLVLFRENDAVGLIVLKRPQRRSTWVSGEVSCVSVSGDKLSYTPRPFAVVAHNGAYH